MNLLEIFLELLDNPNRELRLKYDKDNRWVSARLAEKVGDEFVEDTEFISVRELRFQMNPPSGIRHFLERIGAILHQRVLLKVERKRDEKAKEKTQTKT